MTPNTTLQRPPAPGPAPTSEFPKWKYHKGSPNIPGRLVSNPAEEAALGEEWGDFPFDVSKLAGKPAPSMPVGLKELLERGFTPDVASHIMSENPAPPASGEIDAEEISQRGIDAAAAQQIANAHFRTDVIGQEEAVTRKLAPEVIQGVVEAAKQREENAKPAAKPKTAGK